MRNHGAESIKGTFAITSLRLFQSGRYQERFLRALRLGDITDDSIDTLVEDIRRSGMAFSPSSIAKMRVPLIRLDDQVDRDRDAVEVSRGWDAVRFCFIMEIEEAGASVHTPDRVYLVSGYTDKMEYSKYSRSIPDDLEFYVNSVLEVTGGRSTNNNYLFGAANANSTNETLLMIRPQDVISKYSFTNSTHTKNRDSSYRSDRISGRNIDSASRNNSIGANYLAKTLTGFHQNRLNQIGERGFGDSDEMDNVVEEMMGGSRRRRQRIRDFDTRSEELEHDIERARHTVAEEAADEIEFIRQLRRDARDSNSAGTFSWSHLSRLCPDIQDYTKIATLSKDNLSRSGATLEDNRIGNLDGEVWGGESQEELLATNVANAFSTICNASFILLVDMIFALRYNPDEYRYEWDFEIGYDDRGEIEEGRILFIRNLTDDLQEAMVERLGNVVIDSVLNGFTRYGTDIMVSVQYNANREIFVSVAIDTDRPYELCSAIFCDGLVASNLTTNKNRGVKIGEGVTSIYDKIYREITK